MQSAADQQATGPAPVLTCWLSTRESRYWKQGVQGAAAEQACRGEPIRPVGRCVETGRSACNMGAHAAVLRNCWTPETLPPYVACELFKLKTIR
jgi:hypothetical protein